MSQLCLTSFPASEASVSPLSRSGFEQSDSSNGIQPSKSCSTSGGLMAISTETSKNSQEPNFEQSMAALMSLRGGCLASLHQHSDSNAELLMSVGCGPKQSEWFAKLDRDTLSSRTRQHSLLSNTGKPGMELCQDWPRSGMICGGMLFPLPSLVQGISGKESYSLVPTPRASASESRQTKITPSQSAGTHGMSLQAMAISKLLPTPTVNDGQKRGSAYLFENRKDSKFGLNLPRTVAARLLPTPTTRDYKDTPLMSRTGANGRVRDDQLPRRIYGDESLVISGGMRLTPEFLSWLMGFPVNWLKPLRSALETPSSRKSRKSSRKQSTNNCEAK